VATLIVNRDLDSMYGSFGRIWGSFGRIQGSFAQSPAHLEKRETISVATEEPQKVFRIQGSFAQSPAYLEK